MMQPADSTKWDAGYVVVEYVGAAMLIAFVSGSPRGMLTSFASIGEMKMCLVARCRGRA